MLPVVWFSEAVSWRLVIDAIWFLWASIRPSFWHGKGQRLMDLMQASPFVPYIEETGSTKNKYARLIWAAFDKAIQEKTGLPEWLLKLHGMSGKRYRIFINHLIKSIKDARYLEIGSWAGSTACSAIYGNQVCCTCIDNWSQFGNVRAEFQRNTQNALNSNNTITLYEQDFRTVNYSDIGKFNVYLFDGPHEIDDQYDGLKYALPALDDTFIFIVDDWNDPRPREGTARAIKDLGVEIIYSMQIRTSNGIDTIYPEVVLQDSYWHNGYFIAVCKKSTPSQA
jgi:hypothetical protein